MVGKKKMSRGGSAPSEPKENVVYIPQARRAEWIPNISPECLKLESWLRMKDIPYEYYDNETLAGVGDIQLPHCKVNGKEIPYSNHMLCEIAKLFNKEMPDCADEPTINYGAQRAFEGLIEGSLSWVLLYLRAYQSEQLPPCDVQGRFWQFLRPLANKVATNKLKTKAEYQGIGRQNVAEVLAIGKQDLRAISAYLGGKSYFSAGEQPNKLDATVFAHLCQFWYVPNETELKTYMKEQCPNLIEYMEGIKEKYWADWEEKCRKPTPSRRSKSKDDQCQVANEQEKQEPVEGEAPPAVNGCTEEGEKKEEDKPKEAEPVVEVIKAATPEKEPVENGAPEEQKTPVAAVNGGTTA